MKTHSIKMIPLCLMNYSNFLKHERDNHLDEVNSFLLSIIPQDRQQPPYGIYLDNKLVGYAAIDSTDSQTLDRLYITPQFRNQHIGSIVLEKLNIKKLIVSKTNEKAIDFYLKNNFLIAEDHAYTFLMYKQKQDNKEVLIDGHTYIEVDYNDGYCTGCHASKTEDFGACYKFMVEVGIFYCCDNRVIWLKRS